MNLLITAGAKINAQGADDATALMLSSFFGQDAAGNVLLANGASKISKDCNGITARM